MRIALVVAAAVTFTATLGASTARAEPLTKVFINGVVTPVFFNDGDSFRPQNGPLKGQQSRLAGYNTMESFGAVHSWGTHNAHDLYVNAKQATLEARRGVWHCDTDGKKDGYGRLLLYCKDLATFLISKGLAHTYSVDKSPGDPELLEVQKVAMKNRVGMWSHGVPRFVMTSIHSTSEGGDKDGKSSNRLISTFDAHSEKLEHHDNYEECQKVCESQPSPTPIDLEADIALMKEAAPAALEGLSDEEINATTSGLIDGLLRSPTISAADLAVFEPLPKALTEEKIAALLEAAKKLDADKKLAVNGKSEDSCFVYVDFRRRYGGDRAMCLR